jgi:hypothetical protein
MDAGDTDEHRPEPPRPNAFDATWSDIIRVVQQHGGKIEKTATGYALVRIVGTMLLHFPLPIEFDPDQPDKIGKPGPMAVWSIGRNLDVELPYVHLM